MSTHSFIEPAGHEARMRSFDSWATKAEATGVCARRAYDQGWAACRSHMERAAENELRAVEGERDDLGEALAAAENCIDELELALKFSSKNIKY